MVEFGWETSPAGQGRRMSKTLTIHAVVTIEDGNLAPIIDEQPPALSKFLVGKPASIPFGKTHDPDGDPLTIALIPLVQGLAVALSGNQITMNWDGKGIPGEYRIQVEVDDGK